MTNTPPKGRESAVLEGVVVTYLATGNPVGSRVLVETRLPDVSSATIRHVLVELEHQGLLTQPHVSAGRVPTSAAIRWWLRRLDAPEPLRDEEQGQRFEHALRSASDETSVWLRTSEFLAEISRQVGMVALLPARDTGLKQLRFFRLTEHRVLAILVTNDGQVRERVGRIPEVYTQAELDTASRYLLQNFNGMTLARIRRELVRRVEEERAAYDALLKRVLVLSHCGVLEMQDDGAVFVHGAPHLAENLNADRLGNLLAQLQEKERWLHLVAGLDEDTADRENAAGVQAGHGSNNVVEWGLGDGLAPDEWVRVRVGLDVMPECSLITASCGGGAIGILGPTRMEYQRALGAVALAQAVCRRVLGERTT
ncbi:MAG: HrcA family transcriptional regulator [Terriglobales bacterium]